METTLTSPAEVPVDLKLDWIQDCNDPKETVHSHWFVPYPANHPGYPILSIDYVSRGALTLGIWQITILNTYIIQVELSIWQLQTVKYKAEQELSKAIRVLMSAIM